MCIRDSHDTPKLEALLQGGLDLDVPIQLSEYIKLMPLEIAVFRNEDVYKRQPQNGVILLVMAFLISPMGLPLAAIWLLGKVQSLKFAIQDKVYG